MQGGERKAHNRPAARLVEPGALLDLQQAIVVSTSSSGSVKTKQRHMDFIVVLTILFFLSMNSVISWYMVHLHQQITS